MNIRVYNVVMILFHTLYKCHDAVEGQCEFISSILFVHESKECCDDNY